MIIHYHKGAGAMNKARNCSLPVVEGTYKKAGEGLFTRARSDRTRGS